MKIAHSTPDLLIITRRRDILYDVGFVFMIAPGTLFTMAIHEDPPGGFPKELAILTIFFAALGAWGLLANSSSTARFEAKTRTLSLSWRHLFGTRSKTITFDEIRKIDIEFTDAESGPDKESLRFTLQDGSTTSPGELPHDSTQAANLVAQVTDWIGAHDWPSPPPYNVP